MLDLSETLERKFIYSIDVSDWEIETDTGWKSISQIHKTIPYKKWYLKTESGLELTCADTHIIFDYNMNQIFVQDLISYESKIITKHGIELVTELSELDDFDNMYDITVDDENHRFWSNGILSHNTTTAAGYMLWCVLFQEDYNIAILANKGSLAQDILGRVQYAFEYLPAWMQQGIITWNKRNIELENKSKIAAYATSASGVRGGSYNLIFLDEFAFVPQNMANDFFTSTYPVISSGQSTKVIIVSTPYGLNHFYKMWTDAIEGRSFYNPVEVHWSMVPGRDEAWREMTIANTSEEQFRQEFETEFIGSSATLIPASKLRNLAFKNPLQHNDDGLDIYRFPEEDHIYVLTVDCAEGVGQDYSTISVVDVTDIPYKQVAKYRNNTISPILFPMHIYNIARKYNNAWVLVETNNVGQQVVDLLHYDLEYENIFRLQQSKMKGQHISAGFKKQVSLGVKTTIPVKKIGCANLKALVENDKLLIEDFDTISELNTFVRVRDSYEAEEGNNDDLVMTLVLFSWLTAQNFFKEATNSDIRKRLSEDHNLTLEEEIPLFGSFDDGQQVESFFDGEDLWTITKKGYYPSSLDL